MSQKLIKERVDNMRKPIKISKHLVSKAPIELEMTKNKYDSYILREITMEDIQEDLWLNEREKAFKKMLNDGHIGLIAFNENNECVAYGWVATGNVKPSHIPRIPVGSAWLHYTRVKKEYQGRGLQRLLIQERVKLVRERYEITDIYIDTSKGNIPSRINQKKLGFTECGIYYTVEIGTRKIPFLHILLGKWDKEKKHPEIIENNTSIKEGGIK